MVKTLTVSHICNLIGFPAIFIIRAPNSTPMVRSCTGWNLLSVNWRRRQDFPTPDHKRKERRWFLIQFQQKQSIYFLKLQQFFPIEEIKRGQQGRYLSICSNRNYSFRSKKQKRRRFPLQVRIVC